MLQQPETQLATGKPKKGQAIRSGASSWMAQVEILFVGFCCAISFSFLKWV